MNTMNRVKTLAVAVALAFGASAAQAGVINGGFETGDLTGWSTSLAAGSAAVVTSNTTSYVASATYLPAVGSYFLAMQTGAASFWQTSYQAVALAAGETLSGFAAFDWGDYMPYADGVKVEILNSGGGVVATPFYMDGSLVGSSGYNGPWTSWSWTAASAGTYTLAYAARNTLDGGGPNQTYGYFDATTVPEPGTLAFLGFGLAGLGFLRRRKA